MNFSFSLFGRKFAGESGIFTLMEDLDEAMNRNPDLLFLGGGNPAIIPLISEEFRLAARRLTDSPEQWDSVAGVYDGSQGPQDFLEDLADFFRRHHGCKISARNIALTNGSQNSFFLLFNLLAGDFGGGVKKKVMLPLLPEYIGYHDAGLSPDFFSGNLPGIESLPANRFKYHVNFDRLDWRDNPGLVCLSRPTNPSGNMISDQQLKKLSDLCAEKNLPLLIDNAYGQPFPGIDFTGSSLFFADHIIHTFSLSKLGLPGLRTGIVVAHEEIIEAVKKMNAIINLASGSFGAALVREFFRNDRILHLSREVIRPFYEKKSREASEALIRGLAGLPHARVHVSEGAFFLWLWLDQLPVPASEVYLSLKKAGVLVVSGESYFPGLREDWAHSRQCLRISFAQDRKKVLSGLEMIAETVKGFYS